MPPLVHVLTYLLAYLLTYLLTYCTYLLARCRRWYTFLDDAAFGPASTRELGGATQGHGAGRSDSTWSVDSSPPATGQGGQSGQVPRASRSDSRCVRQLSATRARVLALNASDGKNKCKGVWSKVF